jgi:hypothetical protein
MKDRTIELGGASYRIPRDHIERMTPPGNRVYVRVKPPGAEFTLVLAASSHIARNWQGEDAPLVTHINDIPAKGLEAFDFAGGKTVCRNDIPYLSCGLRIGDIKTGWSVLFNREHLGESEAIRAEASRSIAQYKGAADVDRG